MLISRLCFEKIAQPRYKFNLLVPMRWAVRPTRSCRSHPLVGGQSVDLIEIASSLRSRNDGHLRCHCERSEAISAIAGPVRRHTQIDMLRIISYISQLVKKKILNSQRYLAGHRIDQDTGCGRQPAAAAVDAHAGAQIEPIAVPWAAQHAILRGSLVERPEPMRADCRVSDELSPLELEDAERPAVELDEERQPQLRQRAEPQRCPDPPLRVRDRANKASRRTIIASSWSQRRA